MSDTHATSTTLGGYLRARRAQVSPADVGRTSTSRRRVPGLRREEVAELVGLSIDYYVRLEQGRADRPSDEVLDALCRALLLGSAERAHLYDLARPVRRRATRVVADHPRTLRDPLRQMVEAIPTTPAVIMNDRNDVLAWNHLAAALIADFPNLAVQERNMGRQIFLNPQSKVVHPDWEDAARTTVGMLRMAAGRHPHDPELVQLIGELSLSSPRFRTLWASHHVHQKTHGPKRFHHPNLGDIDLRYETFQLPDAADHLLVIYTAAPGSTSEEALNFLGSLTAASQKTPHNPNARSV
jgi:transcriptional regulator with XRE-family HTH domain